MHRVAMLSVHTSPLASLGGKETGGMNVYVRELTRELALRGVEIDIFTRLQNPEDPQIVEPWEGTRVVSLPAGPQKPYSKHEVFEHLPEFLNGIRQYVQQRGIHFDLIHSHYWLSGWVARQLRAEWRVPIVHMFHTLGKMKSLVAESDEQRETDRRILVEEDIMGYADRIIAATPLDQQQMLELYQANPETIQVVPCGVDLSVFRPIPCGEARAYVGIDESVQALLFVGRLDPVKGLNTLLKAVCLLTRKMHPSWTRDICLIVIGGDVESHTEALTTDMDCLREIREELGLEDLVVFLGSRAQSTLPYYYSASEVCVMPSLYESFGMVALEAMACGTPVLASRVGGLTYTIRDGVTGFLVPEKDPEILAEKLELLLTDHDLRNEMGDRATEVAQGYGWPMIADQVLEIYEDVLTTAKESVHPALAHQRLTCCAAGPCVGPEAV